MIEPVADLEDPNRCKAIVINNLYDFEYRCTNTAKKEGYCNIHYNKDKLTSCKAITKTTGKRCLASPTIKGYCATHYNPKVKIK